MPVNQVNYEVNRSFATLISTLPTDVIIIEPFLVISKPQARSLLVVKALKIHGDL